MSKLLTADDIFQADDLPRERIEVPEWGGHIYIRTMTGAERDSWEESILKMNVRTVNGKSVQQTEVIRKNARANLVSRVCCDESGTSLFSPDQATELGRKSSAALDRCWEVAQRLNHLSDDDIEELTKN